MPEIKIIELLKLIENNINETIYSNKSKPQIHQALRDLNAKITKVIADNEVKES